MAAYELTGTIIESFPAQTFNKGFRKREFVVETGDKYPQKILFTLVQDKCDMLESFGIGDTVNVAFDVKGRDWQDKGGQTKYFVTLEAFRISGQGRADIKKKAQENTEDEDDEIFRSLGIGSEKPAKPASTATQKINTDDDLPWQ